MTRMEETYDDGEGKQRQGRRRRTFGKEERRGEAGVERREWSRG